MLVYIDDREDEELDDCESDDTYGYDYGYGYDYDDNDEKQSYDNLESDGSYFD
ncbi:MAG: hypothetical protein U9N33_04280 [Campylobacterota bacterium]|nr:hypothetical protein [Campylobacterota bacterium]